MNTVIIAPQDSLPAHLLDEQCDENTNLCCVPDLPTARQEVSSVTPDMVVIEHQEQSHELFEFCRELKSRQEQEVVFVVVSENIDSEFWVNAADAGIDHIVDKTAEREVLTLKLRNLFHCISQRTMLAKDLSVTKKIAMTSMAGNNELGRILRFVQQSYAIKNYPELATQFFSVTNSLGLHCCLMMKSSAEQQIFSSDKTVKKVEEDIFSLMDQAERFFDFGCRTIISYPKVALLVKNMPVEDTDRYGQIKDLLPALLEVVNEKVISLETSIFVQSQTERLSESFAAVKRSFQYISELSRENLHEGTRKMQEMMQDLNNRLPGMGLEEDQEVFIIDRIESAISDSSRMLDMSDEMEKIFAGIHDNLQSIVEQQHQLLETTLASGKQSEELQPPDADVELF